MFLRFIKWRIIEKKRSFDWRKKNRHNNTTLRSYVPFDCISVGKNTYGEIDVLRLDQNSMLKIGSYCSIAPKVSFIMGAEHYTSHISTFPFKVKVLKDVSSEAYSKGNIIVDDDVWIGYSATIMSGVHIGQGAVIAAQSLVTKDVPPYAIVGGIPARIIKYRFENDLIKELLKVDFNNLTKEEIKEHVDELYDDLENITQLEWMPKKKL